MSDYILIQPVHDVNIIQILFEFDLVIEYYLVQYSEFNEFKFCFSNSGLKMLQYYSVTKRFLTKKIFLYTLVILPLLMQSIDAQDKVKINKVLDSNLFELEDGRVIKMAGIDAPRKDYPGSYLSGFANEIIYYSERNLAGRYFEINTIADSIDDIHYSLVYISKNYPLGKSDINKQFLEYGFGKFWDNVDSLHKEDYLIAEKSAFKNKIGLWHLRSCEINDTLDRVYTPSEFQYYFESDSIMHKQSLKENKMPIVGKVTIEVFTGLGIGAVAALAGGYTGAWVGSTNKGDRFDALGGAILGAYTGYIVGSSLGVYFIAQNEDPELSYFGTFASSVCGAALGIGIQALSNSHDTSFLLGPLIAPLIGSLLYVNLSDNNSTEQLSKNSLMQDFYKYGNLSFKDFRNKSLSYNINLIHISF